MKKTFKLIGLDCANCAGKIQGAITKIEGVTAASVNFVTTKLTIEAVDEKIEDIEKSVKSLIKRIDSNINIQ